MPASLNQMLTSCSVGNISMVIYSQQHRSTLQVEKNWRRHACELIAYISMRLLPSLAGLLCFALRLLAVFFTGPLVRWSGLMQPASRIKISSTDWNFHVWDEFLSRNSIDYSEICRCGMYYKYSVHYAVTDHNKRRSQNVVGKCLRPLRASQTI